MSNCATKIGVIVLNLIFGGVVTNHQYFCPVCAARCSVKPLWCASYVFKPIFFFLIKAKLCSFSIVKWHFPLINL